MTEKTRTTRFASLEAIPLHAPGPRGLRRVLTTLYIGRRRSVPALVGILGCSVAALLAAPSFEGGTARLANSASSTQETSVRDAETKHPVPLEVVSTLERKLPEPLKDAPSVEDKTSLATEPVSPIVELPSFGSKDPRQATRQIIPVSEAMLLYDGRSTDDPSKTSNSVAKGDLDKPFFVEGLPSEEETLAFFKESSTEVSPRANPVPSTDLPAVEEDMDPTIAIPAVVPTPAVRPQTTDARVEFRIEQGDGVQSGFVLYNKDDKNLRRYFLVARAFRGGETIPWKFKDIADGKDVSTEKFAIEVSETAFRSLSEEKKKFGKVVHEVIGSAKDDKGKIDWAIESNGNMLAAPEGRS